jgi:hypothetical protein
VQRPPDPIGLLASPAVAQGKKEKDVDPIEVIKLDRTDPVNFEKEIYPSFKNKCLSSSSGASRSFASVGCSAARVVLV